MWLLQISDFILVCAVLHFVKCVVLFWETRKCVSKYLYFRSTVVDCLSCAMSEILPPSKMFSGKEWLPLLGEVSCWLVLSVSIMTRVTVSLAVCSTSYWKVILGFQPWTICRLNSFFFSSFFLLLKTPSPLSFFLGLKKPQNSHELCFHMEHSTSQM